MLFLTQQVRSAEDPYFTSLLRHVRHGNAVPDMQGRLNQRTLDVVSSKERAALFQALLSMHNPKDKHRRACILSTRHAVLDSYDAFLGM